MPPQRLDALPTIVAGPDRHFLTFRVAWLLRVDVMSRTPHSHGDNGRSIVKNFKLVLGTAVIAAAASTSASAQFYVGVGAGASKLSGVNSNTAVLGAPVSVSGADSTKAAWKLYGGYQFTPNWGVEAQYTDLGNRTANVFVGPPVNLGGSTGVSANQWSLAGTGTMPVGNAFYLMAKLGATRNHIGGGNITIAGISGAVGGSNRTDLLIGIGGGYNFTKNIGVRLEYENFGKMATNNGINNGSIKADNWSASLKYSF
jgi:OOP family OmpA-OmpF porin